MVESLLVIAVFAVLYGVLHLLFRVCVEAVCLWTIAVTWLLLIPFDPVRWACAVASLIAGAFFGFRVIPAQTIAGLGLPPWLAANHLQFDEIAKRIGSGRLRGPDIDSGFMDMNLEQSMHLSTMRLYNRSVLWAIGVTCGHVLFFQIAPTLVACIPIALTAFPVGFVFKRWFGQTSIGDRPLTGWL